VDYLPRRLGWTGHLGPVLFAMSLGNHPLRWGKIASVRRGPENSFR
jgi:hypothetical protein